MKKRYLTLVFFLTFSSLNAQMIYLEKTTKTYSQKNDLKPSGKILPTNGFEIIKKGEDKSLVKLTGWTKNSVNRILYFSKGKRIIVAVFSKKAKFEINTLKTEKVKKDEWSNVEFTTWIENKNFNPDLDSIYGQANDLLQKNCGLCHAVHDTKEFDANQWPSVIKAMFPRTPLSKEDKLLITAYVQKHAKQ